MLRAGYESYTVGRKSEFYDINILAEVIQNQHRWTVVNADVLAYVTYWDDKGRYMLFCKGHDPRLQHSGSKMLIRTNAGFRGESQSVGADDMYDDSDLVKPEQLPTPYLYHGTYKSVWRLIIDDRLRTGGLKGNRLHNHYSPYPPGDDRNTGGARHDSEVYLEYDFQGIREDFPLSRYYWPEHYCIVSGHEPEGIYVCRVVEVGTNRVLWYNERYYKIGTKVEAEDQRPVYKPMSYKEVREHWHDLEQYAKQRAERYPETTKQRREIEESRNPMRGGSQAPSEPSNPPTQAVEEPQPPEPSYPRPANLDAEGRKIPAAKSTSC